VYVRADWDRCSNVIGSPALPVQQPHRVSDTCGDPEDGLGDVYDRKNAYCSPRSDLHQSRKHSGIECTPALLIACDFSDEVDDPPPELEIFDAQEGLGERKPLARGEKVGHIGR
jgi:hypothetical protein